jgi:uncharacterized protein
MDELLMVENGCMDALERAKRAGKARFTGVSSHNRVWLKSIVEQYPKQVEVVLFPYTANSKEQDSLFEAVRKHDTGVFGIKPFAGNSLFRGASAPSDPNFAEDNRRARLAIRYVLSNPAISAPISGLISVQQVDNMTLAIQEARQLSKKERTELEVAGEHMWAHLRPDHAWLRNWEHV